AVWAWVYEEGRSLDEPTCLEEVSSRAGVPTPRPDRTDLEALERSSVAARDLGVVGVPTFLLDAYPLGIGIQDDGTMLDFLTRFAQRRRAD
ncbi:MAG: hypothetical protein R3190_14120, partial [Thermoanaerobaculia bacterium]|nr:hypothetical protein [Thermoanaerobaculia bacterium]